MQPITRDVLSDAATRHAYSDLPGAEYVASGVDDPVIATPIAEALLRDLNAEVLRHEYGHPRGVRTVQADLKRLVEQGRSSLAMKRNPMVHSLSAGMRVVVEHDGRDISIDIREKGKPKAHGPGFIVLQRINPARKDGNIWEVVASGAHKGYGPLLYDLAMEYVVGREGGLGITPDRTWVSPQAKKIWDTYFSVRHDVSSQELPASLLDPDRAESLQRYYFTRDTPTLDRFESEGVIQYKN